MAQTNILRYGSNGHEISDTWYDMNSKLKDEKISFLSLDNLIDMLTIL